MNVLTSFETSVTICQSVWRKRPRRPDSSTSLVRIAGFPTERTVGLFLILYIFRVTMLYKQYLCHKLVRNSWSLTYKKKGTHNTTNHIHCALWDNFFRHRWIVPIIWKINDRFFTTPCEHYLHSSLALRKNHHNNVVFYISQHETINAAGI